MIHLTSGSNGPPHPYSQNSSRISTLKVNQHYAEVLIGFLWQKREDVRILLKNAISPTCSHYHIYPHIHIYTCCVAYCKSVEQNWGSSNKKEKLRHFLMRERNSLDLRGFHCTICSWRKLINRVSQRSFTGTWGLHTKSEQMPLSASYLSLTIVQFVASSCIMTALFFFFSSFPVPSLCIQKV